MNEIIKVSVQLDTECSWDTLYLYDGRSFKDKLLGFYSGRMKPRPVYATSGAVGINYTPSIVNVTTALAMFILSFFSSLYYCGIVCMNVLIE